MAITVQLGPQRFLFTQAPLWIVNPAPAFLEGAGVQRYTITQAFISDADVGDVISISYIGASLAGSGVSFVPGILGQAYYEYSGVGSASVPNARLRASDSSLTPRSSDSAIHTISITPSIPFVFANIPPQNFIVGQPRSVLIVPTYIPDI